MSREVLPWIVLGIGLVLSVTLMMGLFICLNLLITWLKELL